MSKSAIQLLYEKQAGKTVEVCGESGVICGYDDIDLIVALDESNVSKGWTQISKDDVIVTCLDHEQGYCYVIP